MASDIVARLRDYDSDEHPDNVRRAASDEIERLRADVAAQVAAAERRGIEMAMGAIEAEAQDWRDMKNHEAVMALVCGKKRVGALLTEARDG